MANRSTRMRRRRGRTAFLYLAPALAVYIVFVIVPWLNTLRYSFYNWDGIGPATWAGIANYITVFTDQGQLDSIIHALVLILFFSIFPIVLGLLLAALISRDKKRSWRVSRTLIFLPQVLPLVAVGVAWKQIFAENGLLNTALHAVGLGAMTQSWLGSFTWAFPAVGIVGTWVGTGLCLILFLSGVQSIEPSLYEAVQLDGGGPVREFFAVTLPGLRGEITVAATVTVISALASFDIVYVMTLGGPGDATTVPGVQIYELAFSFNKVGQASALAVVLSILVYIVVLLINKAGKSSSE